MILEVQNFITGQDQTLKSLVMGQTPFHRTLDIKHVIDDRT